MMMMTQAAGEKRPSFDCFLIPGAAGGSRSSSATVSGASDHNKRLKTGGSSGAGISVSSTKANEFGGRKQEKKDRVGEKIAALQQLVSPFGKTDTASVLQEATGYIKFLQDQIQVLSAPYLQTPIMENTQGAERYILRSRGLCLMPLSSTLNIARSNGADIWAPRNTSNCKRQ